MSKIIPVFPIFVLFVFFSSCSKQYQQLFQQKLTGIDTSANYQPAEDHYKIRPQDVLEITNLQNNKDIVDLNPPIQGNGTTQIQTAPAQSAGRLVEDDGTVALTGLGRVPVAGLTRVEAERLIESLYHKTLLKDPIIEVKVANLSVTLFGEVKAPGNFPLLKDRTTLVQMLGTAGGLTADANETNVKIIRGDRNKPQIIQVDLSSIKSISDPKTILQSGDIVYVEKNRRAIRNEKLGNITQIAQPLILLFSTLAIIYTFTRK
jgi:polysaccharide export outer membrane protein